MNAAFLLVTSAMLVGQPGPAPKVVGPAPATPAPVVSSGCGAGGCGYSCDSSCCDSFGQRLRAKCAGLFNRNSCDSCNSCNSYQPRFTHHQSCNTCDTCSQPRAWCWQRKSHDYGCNTCQTQTCQSSCNTGCCGSSSFLDRIKSLCHRNSCDTCNTCNTGCNSGGCGGIVTTPGAPPVKTGEKIDAPKKMPVEAPKSTPVPMPEKKPAAPAPGKVMIDNAPAPIAPNAIPAIPVAPRVEVIAPAPAPTPSAIPVPRVEGNPRDPF